MNFKNFQVLGLFLFPAVLVSAPREGAANEYSLELVTAIQFLESLACTPFPVQCIPVNDMNEEACRDERYKIDAYTGHILDRNVSGFAGKSLTLNHPGIRAVCDKRAELLTARIEGIMGTKEEGVLTRLQSLVEQVLPRLSEQETVAWERELARARMSRLRQWLYSKLRVS